MELSIDHSRRPAPAVGSSGSEHRQRVLLVVEDAPEDLEVIERQLRRLPDVHYLIRTVPMGAAGVAAVRDGCEGGTPPDCVLLDFHLPDMTALEFLEALAELRGQGTHRETGTVPRLPVPVVVLTGTAQRL